MSGSSSADSSAASWASLTLAFEAQGPVRTRLQVAFLKPAQGLMEGGHRKRELAASGWHWRKGDPSRSSSEYNSHVSRPQARWLSADRQSWTAFHFLRSYGDGMAFGTWRLRQAWAQWLQGMPRRRTMGTRPWTAQPPPTLRQSSSSVHMRQFPARHSDLSQLAPWSEQADSRQRLELESLEAMRSGSLLSREACDLCEDILARI